MKKKKDKPILSAASDLAGKTEKAEHKMEVLACHSFQLAACKGEENTGLFCTKGLALVPDL